MLVIFPDIERQYRDRGEFKEGIVEIFDSLAAFALFRSQNIDTPGETNRYEEITDHIKKSESVNAMNEYTWIIQGFIALYYGIC